MPSSGYGMVDLINQECNTPEGRAEFNRRARFIIECAQVAMDHGLFVEWLESFVSAYQQGADIYTACNAGLIEWDM